MGARGWAFYEGVQVLKSWTPIKNIVFKIDVSNIASPWTRLFESIGCRGSDKSYTYVQSAVDCQLVLLVVQSGPCYVASSVPAGQSVSVFVLFSALYRSVRPVETMV